MGILLECSGLNKAYGGKDAIHDMNLSRESGRIVGLLGPNGSGKTTLMKMIAGLLMPTSGSILINGNAPGVETKKIVSYLPDRTYLDDSMTSCNAIKMFSDFYDDFDSERAYGMLKELGVDPEKQMKTLSKGTKEKAQLILVMSRRASLYVLDEPIGGVDPAARDYILKTIIGNYQPESLVLISTHLIAEVESVLDEAVFIMDGKIILHESVDDIRAEHGKSVEEYFREVFACRAMM